MLTLDQKQSIFTFIDTCAVINLPSRQDRLKAVIPELSKIGLNAYYKNVIIPGIRFENLHYMSGRAGCSAAHCRALTYGMDNNLRNILVLEDDCYFLDDNLITLYNAIMDLKDINWDILYLGARVKDKMTDFSKGLYRISSWGCSHATLYSRKIIPYILGMIPKWDAGYNTWMEWVNTNDCLDVYIPRVFGQNADFFIFHTKELCALQVPNFSDINQKYSDGVKILEDDFEKFKQ